MATVGENLSRVSDATLNRFYAFHVVAISLSLDLSL